MGATVSKPADRMKRRTDRAIAAIDAAGDELEDLWDVLTQITEQAGTTEKPVWTYEAAGVLAGFVANARGDLESGRDREQGDGARAVVHPRRRVGGVVSAVEARTVEMDVAFIRRLVVEAMTVEEILVVFGGHVSPSPVGVDLDKIVRELAVIAGLAPEDYFADGKGGVGPDARPHPAWCELEEEAESAARRYFT